jgi:hypothetical protein
MGRRGRDPEVEELAVTAAAAEGRRYMADHGNLAGSGSAVKDAKNAVLGAAKQGGIEAARKVAENFIINEP